jgi:hypothetical protein
MFGRWFRPKPPLATASRFEIDRWLIEISNVVHPVPGTALLNRSLQQFKIGTTLPDENTEAATILGEVAQSVCQDYQIDSKLVHAIFVDENPDGSLVTFQDSIEDHSAGRVTAVLDVRLKSDSLRCVVCIAQAAARADWYSRTGKWPSDPIRDLRVITMGFGAMAAQAFLHDKTWSVAGMQGWTLSRIGTLSSVEVGYAMATWVRRIASNPIDAGSSMRLDARHALVQTQRYYQSLANQPRIGQSTLIDEPHFPTPVLSDTETARLWTSGEATRVYESALETKKRMSESQSKLSDVLYQAVLRLMNSADIDLVTVGTRLWGFCDVDADSSAKQLTTKLRSKENSVFLAAIASALDHGLPIGDHIKRLQTLVNVQANQEFVALDLIDRSGVQSPGLIESLQRQLDLAQKCEDVVYGDRLQKSLQKMNVG